MKTEENKKMEWQTPEVVDLNVNESMGKPFEYTQETTSPVAAPS